jgi:predicted N-acyltransferase
MKYKKNTESGIVVEDDGYLGKVFRQSPWINATKQEFDEYNNSEKLKVKKEKKKQEKRQAYIDSQIQTELDAIDNATTEEELNNIN